MPLGVRARRATRLSLWVARGALLLGGTTLGYGLSLLRRRRAEQSRARYGAEGGGGGDVALARAAHDEPDTILVLDSGFSVRYAAPGLREALGYDPEDILWERISGYLHPDDRVSLEQADWRESVAFRLRDADGAWCEMRAVKVASAGASNISCDGELYRVHSREPRDPQDGTERREEAPGRDIVPQGGLQDPTTGLACRELFMDRLERALAGSTRRARYRKGVTVLHIGMEGFGAVDDALGYAVGDQALHVICLRLRACLRPEDTLTRAGRGEFEVLLEGDVAIGDAVRVAERIVEGLKAPVVVDGQMLHVAASVGIVSGGEHSGSGEELLRSAASVAREAKRHGKDYEIFEDGAARVDLDRLRLESDLRWAIERGELTLHYQPQVLLWSGKAVGLEALLRWEHPVRGTVQPEEFIAFAETTGLIVPIGLWALREACRSSARWSQSSGDDSMLLSVNLSVKQFHQPSLVDELASILEDTGMRPGSLLLEITESLLLDNTRQAARTLRRIKALGVKLALDDFGTGYSSLSYLESLPVDYLKIDQSFVARPGDEEHGSSVLLSTIVGAAEALGIRTIAEGLETEAQVEIIRELRCTMGQGYHFSEPLPEEAAYALLGCSLPAAEAEAENPGAE